MRAREIEKLHKILLENKTQIIKNITSETKEISELQHSEVNDEMDYASLSIDNLIDSAILTQQQEELVEIEEALRKIYQKNFGDCEMCTDHISIERLQIKPHAKYCIDCRTIYEQQVKATKVS